MCVCVCVCLFNVRAEPVLKSRVLKAPKGQRTPGEEGPRAVAKTAKLYSKAKFTAKGVCILPKKYTNALKKKGGRQQWGLHYHCCKRVVHSRMERWLPFPLAVGLPHHDLYPQNRIHRQ